MKKYIFTILNPISSVIGYTIKKLNLIVKFDDLKVQYPKITTSRELGYSILGTYEKNERKLVKKYIKPNDKVLEMGACIGVVSCTINRVLADKSKQVSIEPNPEMYHYLLKNKEINNAKFQIDTRIVSNDKSVDFFIGGEAYLSSNSIQKEGNKIAIKGVSLKKLIEEYFDFTVLVMDIEGGELEFLRSFNLSETNIELIIFESHLHPNILSEEQYQECINLLIKYGYIRIDNISNVEVWKKA